MAKEKPIIICGHCKKEIDNTKEFIETRDVPNEGASIIYKTKNNVSQGVYVDDGTYCNLECLFDFIKKELSKEIL